MTQYYLRIQEKSQKKFLTFIPKVIKREEEKKTKENRRKEIMIRAEINEIQTKKRKVQ